MGDSRSWAADMDKEEEEKALLARQRAEEDRLNRQKVEDAWKESTCKTVIIYHDSCNDGFGAAWAAYRACTRDMSKNALGDYRDQVRMLPASYGAGLPDLGSVKGADVITVDFSYSPEDTLTLRGVARSVTQLDHHATAAERWGVSPQDKHAAVIDEPGSTFIYSSVESGAEMAWRILSPGLPVPSLISYIGDRDLWSFQLPNSRAINAYIDSLPRTVAAYDHLNELLSTEQGRCEAWMGGERIMAVNEKLVEQMAGRAILGSLKGYLCAFVNAPVLQSEVGEALYTKHPHCIAVMWWPEDDGLHLSFRSRPGIECVSLAQEYGGGGHAQAAGAVLRDVRGGITDLGDYEEH